MDLNSDSFPKNRKRSSGKINDPEEAIPFTRFHKPTGKIVNDFQESDSQPTPNCQNNTRCYFCDFCDNTSIHGFKFLGERQRYIIEKIWWLIVVTCAITGSGILIYNTYVKWAKAPVIVTFATTETPIWTIPFPAVTICPELKVDKAYLNYSDVFREVLLGNPENITETDNKYFSFFQLVCTDFGVDLIDDRDFIVKEEYINSTDVDYYLSAFHFMDTKDCKWMGKEYPCDTLLSVTYTSEGRCRTFNRLDEDDLYVNPDDIYTTNATDRNIKKWSLEEGYPSNSDLDTYPYRTIISGTQGGFHIELKVLDEDLDYACGELQGFKVTLHHPAEEPDMDRHFRVPIDEAVYVAVKPRMMTTADDIGSYKPQKRHCFLPGERTLPTFNIYTQQNCMVECLTNYTEAMCGCVGFWMPNYVNESRFCNLNKKQCMEKARVAFLQNDIGFSIDNGNNDNKLTEQCDCLPACTSIEFDAETSQTKYDWKKSFSALMNDDDLVEAFSEGEHYSRLIVYYKDMQFMTSERHELYGTVDFLANCGGLLGLFCGFSFTSLMEILYYLTLRLACNFKRFGQRVWSGAPELM